MEQIYKSFVTVDFDTVVLPKLKGTPKQIKFANDIRDKYCAILQKKLSNMSPLKREERRELTKKFNEYVQNPVMLDSYKWIECHCAKCGCYMQRIDGTAYCTNEYCNYTKTDYLYTNR